VVPRGSPRPSVEAAIQRAVKEITNAGPVNAVIVWAYNSAEEARRGPYTVGMAERAPDGDWGRAGSVRAGDYSRHRYKFSFR
jgi:hypothetical protein